MINDPDDMKFLAAYFCTANGVCLDKGTEFCYGECPNGRYVPGWEEVQEMVRDDDRRKHKEETKAVLDELFGPDIQTEEKK